jgi:peptidylprolyl isomerase
VDVRANRRDQFFVRPAGAADICNLMPPVREVTR